MNGAARRTWVLPMLRMAGPPSIAGMPRACSTSMRSRPIASSSRAASSPKRRGASTDVGMRWGGFTHLGEAERLSGHPRCGTNQSPAGVSSATSSFDAPFTFCPWPPTTELTARAVRTAAPFAFAYTELLGVGGVLGDEVPCGLALSRLRP